MDVKILKDNVVCANAVFDGFEILEEMFPCSVYTYEITSHNYSETEIDAMVVEKIRENYDINKEAKMLRMGILDSTNSDFIKYNAYIEECREWGRRLKESGGDV